jgi:hypothetical protein
MAVVAQTFRSSTYFQGGPHGVTPEKVKSNVRTRLAPSPQFQVEGSVSRLPPFSKEYVLPIGIRVLNLYLIRFCWLAKDSRKRRAILAI